MRMKFVLAAVLAMFGMQQAMADDLVQVKTDKSVGEAMDALQAAVEGAGATVFARIDHAAGAQKVDLELDASQVLIFGNPKLGTPVMQADTRAGLFLPLKVHVYADGDGQVWLAYQDPADMLDELNIDDDLPAIEMMQGALGKLTGKAAAD